MICFDYMLQVGNYICFFLKEGYFILMLEVIQTVLINTSSSVFWFHYVPVQTYSRLS